MLSLPLFLPQGDYSTHLRHSHRPRPSSPPPPPQPQHIAHGTNGHRAQHPQRPAQHQPPNPRSSLALLAVAEANIAHNKSLIRHFGAHWIQPPGVARTLQAQLEAQAEAAEQLELERQQQGIQDLQARQAVEEARLRAAEAEAATAAALAQGGVGVGVERDLDDEIPDADAGVGDVTQGAEEGGADVTFNEESLLEGSVLEQQHQMEEAELTGAARDEEELGIEHEQMLGRDLDDSVPDAGSYQHTDTEAEDSTDDSEADASASSVHEPASTPYRELRTTSSRRSAHLHARSFGQPSPFVQHSPAMQRLHAHGGVFGGQDSLPRSPGSLNLSSSLVESSFVGDSSPMMQRAGHGNARRGNRLAGTARGGGVRRG